MNSRKPAVIAMWLLFVCGFAFAVYKNFTAIDSHTVHEKEIVERRVEDTSGVEAFVRNFVKNYYSWSNNKDSVVQRTDALTGYLTEDLQRLTADTVRSDVAVSAAESEDITDFLTTFFTLYPTATEKELSYYVSGGFMPPVKCADYTFSQLKSMVLNKNGDTVTATVAVEYLDSITKMTQVSQFEFVLKLVDGNWKIVG